MENLNEQQACQYFGGITPRTLLEWRRKRGLPHIKLTAKVIIYRRGDLDGWMERHRVAMRSLPGTRRGSR
ncbi:MAG TPA: helix-turn-helix domain-containing protein [Verrucomicrobiae bacterium]